METTNDPTDRIVFVSSGSQMVKITRILKYRLEISPKVGFSVADFFDTRFSNFFLSKVQNKYGVGGSDFYIHYLKFTGGYILPNK